MAAQAVTARRGKRAAAAPASGPLAWVVAIPPRLRMALAALVAILVVAGGGLLFYRALDPMYPQDLWRYFRPQAPAPTGALLYRDLDGQLFLAPQGDAKQAQRLLDAGAAAGGREYVRDAIYVPQRKQIAYFATVRRDGAGGAVEHDHVKLIDLSGKAIRDMDVTAGTGEPIRPTVYASASGRYLAVTNRERTQAYFYDLDGGGGPVAAPFDSPPERMLWTRNADLRQSYVSSQAPVAASQDGAQRAQVRAGRRRAPECDEQRCETAQELVVSSGGVTASQRAATLLYGAFSAFSAEGWGPVPPQPAQRLYGRLVWSPDGKQLLFSTLDGDVANTYAISTDGRTQPRLVLEAAEALDWLP